MNETKICNFLNKTLGQIRVIVIDDVPWFVANDVCKALGYTAPRNAIHDHVSVEYRKALKYKACIETMRAELWGENDYMDKVLLTEAGMWQLVFGSKLQSAMTFQAWIFETVLPSLRENGGYIVGQEDLDSAELDSLKTEIKALHKKVRDKQYRIEELSSEKDLLNREVREKESEIRYWIEQSQRHLWN